MWQLYTQINKTNVVGTSIWPGAGEEGDTWRGCDGEKQAEAVFSVWSVYGDALRRLGIVLEVLTEAREGQGACVYEGGAAGTRG